MGRRVRRRLPATHLGPRLCSALVLVTSVACAAGDPVVVAVASDVESAVRSPTSAHPFRLGGQDAWYHEDGNEYGAFHTYDDHRACPDLPGRPIHVLVPHGYDATRGRYPVVYVNDGDTAFWPGGPAGKSWWVQHRLAELRRRGHVDELLVVAVRPLDRDHEYTHVAWAPTRRFGGLEDYARYLLECLKPWIDGHYATDPRRERTLLVGSSHGGLASFFTAARHPDTFGHAAALSASFWVGLDEVWQREPGARRLAGSRLLELTSDGLRGQPRPRFWIDWGLRRSAGFHDANVEALATARSREMATLLQREFGYRSDELFLHEDPIGGHDEDAWSHRFGLAVQRLLGSE